MPAIVAACALDAGTQMFTPEGTAKIFGETYGQIPEFKQPLQAIAKAIE